MSHLPILITDLALILVCAGVMTLIFKKLKQPLVLGYVVAGFLTGPHMPYVPSIIDKADVKTWADIGVIFLLFALGLEFSVKKILKVGGTAVIATCTIIICMIFLGIVVGMSFGWHRTDCIFLGGMIAMSSTTIIYKAFEDLGISKKQFAGLVLSILILEDILAIVLMVLLPTISASNNFQGAEMMQSIGKLIFFLVLWFVVGIYLIPGFLKRCRKLMNDETLLIVSLALCFIMVVFASKVGFSAAFGAFIMGSILAETLEAERIDRLVKPVKDLFGAIFFVSVGMMVDPNMIAAYYLPIIVITLSVIIGQSFFGTVGVILAGQPLKTAMQCGFSLTQIGEFAFIIASLGVSMNVTSDFLYPIVVAVSVITTFVTPYMIRLAEPASSWVDRKMPGKWKMVLSRYSTGAGTVNNNNLWKKLLVAMARITLVYSIVSIFIVAISFRFIVPIIKQYIPAPWGALLSAALVIVCVSPFLRAILIKKNHSEEFTSLWQMHIGNRAPLIATILLRAFIVVSFVVFIISALFRASIAIVIGVAIILVCLMVASRRLKKHSIQIERTFFQNLHSRETRAVYMGEKKPAYAGGLLSHDLHLADYDIPGESLWAGKSLQDLNLGMKYGVHVVSILRGRRRFNIPGGKTRIFPMDKIQVIGTDEQLDLFGQALKAELIQLSESVYSKGEMTLQQIMIDADSSFLGKTLRDSGIRDVYRCLIAGVEHAGSDLMKPDVNNPFVEGDVLWVVGEKEAVHKLVLASAGKD